MRLFNEVKGKGTYATPERAELKITNLTQELGVEFRYIIMVTVDQRYAPVVILDRDKQWMTGGLAGRGICVTF